jgi:predicted DNA binding CopG/RHH family protein
VSPARRTQKTTGEAAEIIAGEKSLRDLRQALALTQERMARALKERARVRGVPYQRFVRETSKHALNGRA